MHHGEMIVITTLGYVDYLDYTLAFSLGSLHYDSVYLS